ncbi:hypothetical protein [Leifsonia aquatica]|uniref:hypothetical protein n=1 Tax=Leifsonia aquatica TaxID=144185 RepID=UPI00381C9364
MGTDLPDDARLRAQLDRLRAVLHPPAEAPAPPSTATELLAFGRRPGGFVAVRITDAPLVRPGGGAGSDWRLTVVALTGLDAERLCFVPVPRGVEHDLLRLLGMRASRPERGAPVGCTSSHALIRDERGVERPRTRPGGAAAAR